MGLFGFGDSQQPVAGQQQNVGTDNQPLPSNEGQTDAPEADPQTSDSATGASIQASDNQQQNPEVQAPDASEPAVSEMPKSAVYNVYTAGGQLKRAFAANDYAGSSERALKAAEDFARPINGEVRPG